MSKTKNPRTPPASTAPIKVPIGDILAANNRPFVLLAGPCSLESRDILFRVASRLKKIKEALRIPIVFKCSFDKANRSSIDSFRGPGLARGLDILAEVKERFGLPLLTDVHETEQIDLVARVVDILQIPAFLCRQTDLLLAAGKSGKTINVKKGQFMAPWDMKNVIRKIESTGNKQILLTERGTSFGYNNLVVDMRSLEVMKNLGYPVIYDATHSVQLPGGLGNASGGQREFVYPLARAATALGVAGFFMEVHPDPDRALSDGPNSFRLSELSGMLKVLRQIDKQVKR